MEEAGITRDPESGGPEDRPKRLSLRPSAPPAPPSFWSHNHRILFAILWIGAQVALVVTADRRVDGAFGFRMFPESSTIKVALYREIAGPAGRSTVHVSEGVWSAHAPDGGLHRLTWYDRVPTPYWVFDQEVPASYGAATQLARLQAALDDVATHVPHDGETLRFFLDVTVRRNGREPTVHRLLSPERGIARPEDGGP